MIDRNSASSAAVRLKADIVGSGRTFSEAGMGLLLLVLMVLLSACGSREERNVRFDGVHFSSSAKAVDRENIAYFEASVRNPAQSLDGARQAIRYAATKYCVRNLGVSDVEWDSDPDSDSLVIDGSAFSLRGRCIE